MNNSFRTTVLHLSLIPSVGPLTIRYFFDRLGFDRLPDLYRFSARDIQELGISARMAEKIVAGLACSDMLMRECSLIEQYGFSWYTMFDQEYPAYLKAITAPPAILYVRGLLLPDSARAVAFVGSRKASGYGELVIKNIVPEIARNGVWIISGGAIGADTMAHRAAIECGGKTIAVIGSGLLRPYPVSNKSLFAAIVERGGAVVSPFPLQAEPLPENFPARNRVIAGLSQACVVVQAAEKSGALITARFALEQGREVCAIPGRIDDPLSAGCHALLKEGAALVSSARDILLMLGMEGYNVAQAIQKNIPFDENQKDVVLDPLLAACDDPVSVDDLLVATGYSLDVLHERLFSLQLAGRLEQNFMGLWQKKR